MTIVLVACGDDPMSTGDRLTRGEAETIAGGVTQTSSSASGSLRPQSGGTDVVASPPRTFTVDHESSHPCPRGGRIGIALEVTFTADVEGRDYSYDAEGSLTHEACAYIEEGVTLTVTGDPNISYEAHAAVRGGQPQGQFTSEAGGAFDWTASDGRSGRCVVDLSDITDFAAKTRTIEGQVCGHTIRHVTTWT
ncbi:MAG: hypothetical protein ACRENP_03820 [Longimicrobiales bacterium]